MPGERPLDLPLLVAGAAALALPVATGWAPLLYPLALLSGAAILLLLGAVNAMLALVLLRREARGLRLRDTLGALVLGMGLACLEIVAIAALRAYLTARFALPL